MLTDIKDTKIEEKKTTKPRQRKLPEIGDLSQFEFYKKMTEEEKESRPNDRS